MEGSCFSGHNKWTVVLHGRLLFQQVWWGKWLWAWFQVPNPFMWLSFKFYFNILLQICKAGLAAHRTNPLWLKGFGYSDSCMQLVWLWCHQVTTELMNFADSFRNYEANSHSQKVTQCHTTQDWQP
jgi:hypothetical protein